MLDVSIPGMEATRYTKNDMAVESITVLSGFGNFTSGKKLSKYFNVSAKDVMVIINPAAIKIPTKKNGGATSMEVSLFVY